MERPKIDRILNLTEDVNFYNQPEKWKKLMEKSAYYINYIESQLKEKDKEIERLRGENKSLHEQMQGLCFCDKYFGECEYCETGKCNHPEK